MPVRMLHAPNPPVAFSMREVSSGDTRGMGKRMPWGSYDAENAVTNQSSPKSCLTDGD